MVTHRQEISRLRSVLVRVREALADGDFAGAIALADSGLEVATSRGIRCPDCGLGFRFVGELDHHLAFVHWEQAA